MLMTKINEEFVRENKDDLICESFQNAERLFEDAKTLKEKKSFCSSLFLAISALEELAKWHFLQKGEFIQLSRLCDHNFKIEQMLKIFREVIGNQNLQKEDSAWLKNNRIKEMREDVLYVRLNMRGGDKAYPIFPDETYWQKRAKAMINLLENIFRHFKNNSSPKWEK